MSGDKKYNKFWNTAAIRNWSHLTSPWRPSFCDIKNYRQGISLSRHAKNFLILGATPELRDLVAEFDGNVSIVDYSHKMLNEMSSMLKRANPKDEKWIIDDWCRCAAAKKNNFDVILGDLAFRLVSPKKQELFLLKIAELLRPAGLFITRIHFVDSLLKKLSSDIIIETTLNLIDPFIPAKGRQVSNILISRLLDKHSGLPTEEKIREVAHSDIQTYLKNNPFISLNRKNILKGACNRIKKGKTAPFFLQAREEIKEQIGKFFAVKCRLVSRDYEDAKYFPIYILKLRKCRKKA